MTNSTSLIRSAYLDSVDDLCRRNHIVSPFKAMPGEGKRASVTYYADLGIIGSEIECEAHYILERDERGLYPVILQLIVRDKKCGLYGRDIYGDHIKQDVEDELVSLAAEKEGL